jgi:stress response protein SCP2
MAINLQKGQKIDLTKGNSGLKRIMVGLGWDEVEKASGLFAKFSAPKQDIDCDASAILCGENGKLLTKELKTTCVFYGNLTHSSGAIVHQGDNLTGAGEGDDEQIMVELAKVPAEIHRIVFVVNIYDANVRKQHFGLVKNAFIRLVDLDKNSEICRYNLSENYDGMTGLVVGEIYRYKGEWKFNAIGQPVKDASRINKLCEMYI